MKRLHILFALALLTSHLFGQTQSDFFKKHLDNKKWQEGIIRKKDGQQVAGLIRGTLDEPVNVKGVVFIAIDGMEEEIYSAKQLQSFTISILYRFVSIHDQFYQILHQGKRIALLRQATYASAANQNGTSTSSIRYDFFLCKNGEENVYRVTDQKNKLSSYFSDCESLSKKIKAGEYKTGSPILHSDPDKKKQVLIDVIGYYDYCE
jgi:hypothetical protein